VDISLVGGVGKLAYKTNDGGLTIEMPASGPCKYAYAIKIEGLRMNPSTWTESGNPQ
jgi:hypothetical protein